MDLTVKIFNNEYWYGFRVDDGLLMPFSEKDEYTCLQASKNNSTNQEFPLLLSSKGRYLWCDQACDLYIKDGTIQLTYTRGTPMLFEGFENLRGAYLAAAKKHFVKSGKIPPQEFFMKPQYNTWIELTYDQNQEAVMSYARNIISNGLPAGILMIDDNWNSYYGKWEFNRETFPDPKGMVEELHRMGFSVMLWICPFVSPDSREFRYLEEHGCLVKDNDGKTAIRHWWNGNSAVLDCSNPEAIAWFHKQTDHLMQDYGIDGFKFDAGDVRFYRDSDVTFGSVSAAEQCCRWAKLGSEYAYNEFRACFGAQGLPLIQRLSDKHHKWKGGVDLLIPNALAQGILGYAYGCPDMIGGGDFEDFKSGMEHIDEELFVRYAQCAALMPMMQYSAAPWRVLSKENAVYCLESGKIHEQFADKIYQLAKVAAKTGDPIIRYMEYVFPGCGYETVTDQFMVGDDLLVAPVLQKGMRERTVQIPNGTWLGFDQKIYHGKTTVKVTAELDQLPYFEKKA